MFWNIRTKKQLEMNSLICDAIKMGVADKYLKDRNIKGDCFELALMGRAINWAIPKLDYEFNNDLSLIENEDYQKKFKEDEDKIFIEGLKILNDDPMLGDLITHYVVKEVDLINSLYPKYNNKKYPGMNRLNKFLYQSLDKLPNSKLDSFKNDYKQLFIKFNTKYGKYGKVLSDKTVDALFSMF